MNENKTVETAHEADLGPLQREVLSFIWEHPGCCVRDCRDHLDREAARDYAYTTIQTVFDALHRKRLVARKRAKNAYRYIAVKSRSGLLSQGLHELLARFGGVNPVASSLVDALEDGDRRELDALIDELRQRGHIG